MSGLKLNHVNKRGSGQVTLGIVEINFVFATLIWPWAGRCFGQVVSDQFIRFIALNTVTFTIFMASIQVWLCYILLL